jgi:malonyl-CoA/methylmalonyl-CoA synthetase
MAEETEAKIIRAGWMKKKGNKGNLWGDRYFTLRGRKSDLIISGGFNIYPREIEEFLLEQTGNLSQQDTVFLIWI